MKEINVHIEDAELAEDPLFSNAIGALIYAVNKKNREENKAA
jgi:hypothetical protein